MDAADGPAGTLRADARENLQRILVAAREVFASQGLDATLADVARHAGVGVGTIYRRFDNKEALIEALFVSRFQALTEVAGEAEAIPDPWDGLIFLLREVSQMMAQDHGLRDLMYSGVPGAAGEDFATSVRDAHTVINSTIERIVAKAKKNGDLRGDFAATDLPVLAFSIQASMQIASSQSADLWRRTQGIIIDGMRASRASYSSLESEALTADELANAIMKPDRA